MNSLNQERFTEIQKTQIGKLMDDAAQEALMLCSWLKVLVSEGQIAAKSGDVETAVAIMREVERFTNGQRNGIIGNVADREPPR